MSENMPSQAICPSDRSITRLRCNRRTRRSSGGIFKASRPAAVYSRTATSGDYLGEPRRRIQAQKFHGDGDCRLAACAVAFANLYRKAPWLITREIERPFQGLGSCRWTRLAAGMGLAIQDSASWNQRPRQPVIWPLALREVGIEGSFRYEAPYRRERCPARNATGIVQDRIAADSIPLVLARWIISWEMWMRTGVF